MGSLDSIDGELEAVRAFHERRDAAGRIAEQFSEQQVRAAVSVHDLYRFLPPGAALALGSAGLGPDSDVVNRLATGFLAAQATGRLAQAGEPMDADELAAMSSSQQGALGRAASKRFGVDYDTNVRGLGGGDGQGGGGFLQGLKQATLEDWDDPMSKVRGLTRAADTYGRFPSQYATGQYRNFRQQVRDKGLLATVKDDLTSPSQVFRNSLTATLQTDVGVQTSTLAGGDRVDTGSGFFVNDTHGGTDMTSFVASEGDALDQYLSPEELAAKQAKQAAEANRAPTGVGADRNRNERTFGPTETWADGSVHAITIGRDIAGHLLDMEPGTRGYSVVSGFADAAVQIASQKPSAAAAKERSALKAFKGVEAVADDASALERARASVGAIMAPGRRMTYDSNIAHSWVNGPDGQSVAEHFAGVTSTRTLDRLTGEKLSVSTLRQLADASTTEDVSKVLHEALSAHELQQQVSSAPWRRMGIDVKDRLPRFANRAMDIVPDTAIDLTDGRATLTQTDRWASAMKLSEEERDAVHDALAKIPDAPTFVGDGLDHYRAVEHANLTQKARAQVVQDMVASAGTRLMDRVSKWQTVVDEGVDVHGAAAVYKAEEKVKAARARVDEVLKFGFGRGDEDVRYWQNAMNENPSWFGSVRLGDGTDVQFPRRAIPSLSSETVHGKLPMPDPDEVRKAFNSPLMRGVMKVPGLQPTTVALEHLMDKWRTVSLLKPALGIRIIGDTQARILADGGDSIVNHPLRAIAWMLGDSKFNESTLARGNRNMLGQLFNREDAWAASMNRNDRQFWQNVRYKRTEGHKVFTANQDGFADAWHYQLSKLHASAPGQIVASAPSLDDAHGAWWDLADVREAYARAHPPQRSLPGALSGDDLLNPQGAASFLEDTAQRLRHITQDDPRLVAAIKTGNLHVTDPDIVARAEQAGYAVSDIDGVPTAVLPLLDGIDPNPLVTDALASEFGDVAQRFGNKGMVGRVAKIDEMERTGLNRLTDALFAAVLGRPDNFIDKSPFARQEYWNFVRERIAYLDPLEVDTIVRNAENAKLPRDQIRSIKRLAGKAGVDSEDLLTSDEMHALAESHAMQRSRDLLDDMSHRHQAFDMVKLIMPFGEAWHQVLTKWSKMLAQPHVWPEMSVAARALRSPELGQTIEPGNAAYDTETGEMRPRGLFYKDENNNEVVAFPLSRQMLGLFGGAKQAVLGGAGAADVPLTGRVKGLSVGLDVMPGLGPVAQIPMAMLSDKFDDPKYDGIRDLMFPMGEPSGSLYQKIESAAVPAWLKKIAGTNAGFNDRQWSAQVIDSVRYLASTGEYKVSGEGASQDEITRLVEDAKSQARVMAWARGLAQTTSPTAPSIDWQIEDKTGKRISAMVLGRELHEMQSSDDPEVRDKAILNFLTMHGEGAFALLQGKSMSISPAGALPPTKEARDWLNSNGFAQDAYPLTYGLFAPKSPDHEFDSKTYFDTIEAGDRQALDPEVALKLANAKVAQALYYSVRNKFGATVKAEDAVKLRQFREELERRYPGYSAIGDKVPGSPVKATRTQVVEELARAVQDERLNDAPVTAPLNAYLQLRSKAEQMAVAAGKSKASWTDSPDAQSLRQMMFEVGTRLSQQSPAFASAWETVLLPEFDNALVDQQGGN